MPWESKWSGSRKNVCNGMSTRMKRGWPPSSIRRRGNARRERSPMAALNPFERAALQKAVEAARGMNARYPYPALLTIAEWALASDWGHLQPGNNPFRIPAYPYCFGIQEWPKTNGGQRPRAAPPRRVFYAVFEDLTQAFLKYEAMRVTTLGVHPHYFAYFQGEIDQEEHAR